MKNYGEALCLWCSEIFIKNMHNKIYCDNNVHFFHCSICDNVESFTGTPSARQKKAIKFCADCTKIDSKRRADETKLKRYGKVSYNNREKAKKTMKAKYGGETTLQSPSLKIRFQETMVEKYGGKCVKESSISIFNSAQRRSNRTGTPLEKSILLSALLSDREKMAEWLETFLKEKNKAKTSYGEISDYFQSSDVELSHWFNKNKDLKNRFIRLRTSFLEEKVCHFIKMSCPDLLIERRMKVIYPYELDIYIAEKKIAFEINDFGTHSKTENEEISIYGKELDDIKKYKKGPAYHQNKEILAKDKGIDLFFLWEDEIKDNSFEKKVTNVLCN